MTQSSKVSRGKSAYKSPKLVHFGSVRNLTGGSIGSDNDGMGVMSATMTMGMGM